MAASMDPLFGVSQICTLFLWGCICFPPQKGCNIAHGSIIDENPQTSNQFHSLNAELSDTTQAAGQQSFISPQREPVQFDVTGLGENLVQHHPDSEQLPSAPAVQKYESIQHPFGVLLKQHAPMKTVEGISLPTIRDLRGFIETMKSSYLKPASDSSRYFQTARETLKNVLISGADTMNGESSVLNSEQDGSAHDDHSKTVGWSEPAANGHKPMSESLYFFNPIDSTESVISPSGYDDSGFSSAFDSQHHLGATEQVLNDYGSSASGGISGRNHDIFSRAADVQNDVQSRRHNLPRSFSSHVPASPATSGSSEDLSLYLNKKSIVKPLQQPTYSSPSGDSFTEYQQSIDFQREEPSRMTEVDLVSVQRPLNSYGKSIFVSPPRTQFYNPDVSKHKGIPAELSLTYKPTVGKESNINHRPVSNFDLSPQSHMGLEVSGKKQPVRSYLFRTKPPSSQESSRHDGYLPNQRVSAPHPSISAQAKPEMSDMSKQNLVSDIQEPKVMNNFASATPSNGLDSAQRESSSDSNDVQASYPTIPPPTSKQKVFSRLFGYEAKSNNFEVRNVNSDSSPPGDEHGAKKTQDPRGVSLTGVSVGDTTASHTFTQPTIVQRHPASETREPITRAFGPPETLATSKVSAGNTERLLLKRRTEASPKYVKLYVKKSRKSYARSKVFLSNSRYSSLQSAEDKTNKNHWKSDPVQRKALFGGGGEQQ